MKELRVIERFQADFNLNFYEVRTELSEIYRHVGAFLGEKLLAPRSQDLWIGKNGTLDPNYISMMQKSIQYWADRGDHAAVVRFQSELMGMQNLSRLVIGRGNTGEEMPSLAIASDPGSFYVDDNGNKKSVTFVGVIEKAEIEGWKYRIFSIPTKYIGLEKHKELLWQIGNIEQTMQILGTSLEEITAENLVAFPVILNNFVSSLDSVAQSLGYQSWNEIEKYASDQLALENDDYAKSRRETMVNEFSELIYQLVNRNGSNEEKESLVNSMSEIFALEQGREYLGWNEERIKKEIRKNTKLALAYKLGAMENQYVFENYAKTYDLGNWYENFVHLQWMQNTFNNNSLAREALSTGCGGSGNNYQQDIFGMSRYSFGYERFTYSGFEEIQGYETSQTDDETWSYSESGTCGGCGKSSDEVGLLGPCKICKICVEKIEAQVE